MLRKLIHSLVELPEREVKNNEIAAVCGTSESMISQFFGYEKELSFYHYIAIIRNYSPNRELELVDLIAEEFINLEHRNNCRMIMEYASTTRNFTLLKKMIDSQLNAPKENKDWAKLYSLVLKFQSRSVPADEILIELEEYSPKYLETKALTKILLSMVYYRVGEFKSMQRSICKSEILVESIKNPYIRESFTARVCDVFSRIYLYVKNDPKKARYYANNVINSPIACDKFKVHLYHLIGTSFLFESHEEAVSYFETYKKKLIAQGRFELAEEVKNKDIFFANVLWGIGLEFIETNDDVEECHRLARIGKPVLNLDIQNDPFYLSYKGIAEKSAETLMKAAVSFLNSGNKFFANLPINELKKYENYRITAETLLQNINIA